MLENDFEYLAHVSGEPKRVHLLRDHLVGTAELAAKFAESFGAGRAGERAGLLHDVGKYQKKFQRRVRGENVTCDHSTPGAILAAKERDMLVAMCVAGHHTGLPNLGTSFSPPDSPDLMGRLKRKGEFSDCLEFSKDIEIPTSEAPMWLPRDNSPRSCFSQAFYIRMIYSCLVDADFLNTEEFMEPEKKRDTFHDSWEILKSKFDAYIKKWGEPTSKINRLRSDILARCMDVGKESQGIYTVTVPTGGGKTTATMGFAINHALQHNLERIIYVIPYTSIIEQVADVFRDIFGPNNVLEHHSNFVFEASETEANDPQILRLRLAAENWDLPIVVTTTVQFYESLFAGKSSRCRKLHNIAKSVIIFDEAQMLPLENLFPCVIGLTELYKYYGATVVLCTATQPFLDRYIQMFCPGVEIKEIMEAPDFLYDEFVRVRYEHIGTLTIEELTDYISKHDQVLCIVNNRKTAQILRDLLGDQTYHLSTRMTPRHRRNTIDKIRHDLAMGIPCKVISTSLIEAGVDLDFPTVFREEAGLDSIRQAGGRCNREGKRTKDSSVVNVFELSEHSIPFSLRKNIEAMNYVTENKRKFDGLEVVKEYFVRLRYYVETDDWTNDKLFSGSYNNAFDIHKVLSCHAKFNLRDCHEQFAMIDNVTSTIYIPNSENRELIEKLRCGNISREEHRILTQDAVQVFSADIEKYAKHIEVIYEEGESVTAILWDDRQYSPEKGLLYEPETGFGDIV